MIWTDDNTKPEPCSYDMDGEGTPFRYGEDILKFRDKRIWDISIFSPWIGENGDVIYIDSDSSMETAHEIVHDNGLSSCSWKFAGTPDPPDDPGFDHCPVEPIYLGDRTSNDVAVELGWEWYGVYDGWLFKQNDADRYWVAGDGNWSDNTNHWSASSGGAPGASKPTVADNIFVDNGSDSGSNFAVTLDESTAAGLGTISINCTDYTANLAVVSYTVHHDNAFTQSNGNVTFTTGTWQADGAVTVSGGVFGTNSAAFTLDFNANLSASTGTLHAPNASGSFTFSGSTWNTPTTFTHNSGKVTFDLSGTVTVNNTSTQFYMGDVSTGCTLQTAALSITWGGDFVSNGTFTLTTGIKTFQGTVSIPSGGVLGFSTGWTCYMYGDFLASGGEFKAPGSGGQFRFYGQYWNTPTTFTKFTGTVRFERSGTTYINNTSTQFNGFNVYTSSTIVNTQNYNITCSMGIAVTGTLIPGSSDITTSGSSGIDGCGFGLNVAGTLSAGSGTHTFTGISYSGTATGTYNATSATTYVNGVGTSNYAHNIRSTQTFAHNNGTFSFTYAGNQLMYSNVAGTARTYYNLIVNNAACVLRGVANQGPNVNVANNLTIPAGTYNTADLTSGTSRNLVVTNLTNITGSLIMNAAPTGSLGSGVTSEYAVIVNSGGTIDCGTTARTYGSISIANGGTWIATSNTLTINSEKASASNSILVGATATYTHSSGEIAITYAGVTQIDFGGDNCYSLTINNASADVTVVTNAIVCSGNLTVTSGSFKPHTGLTVTGASSISGYLPPATTTLTFNGACSVQTGGSLGQNSSYTLDCNSSLTMVGASTFHSPDSGGVMTCSGDVTGSTTMAWNQNGVTTVLDGTTQALTGFSNLATQTVLGNLDVRTATTLTITGKVSVGWHQSVVLTFNMAGAIANGGSGDLQLHTSHANPLVLTSSPSTFGTIHFGVYAFSNAALPAMTFTGIDQFRLDGDAGITLSMGGNVNVSTVETIVSGELGVSGYTFAQATYTFTSTSSSNTRIGQGPTYYVAWTITTGTISLTSSADINVYANSVLGSATAYTITTSYRMVVVGTFNVPASGSCNINAGAYVFGAMTGTTGNMTVTYLTIDVGGTITAPSGTTTVSNQSSFYAINCISSGNFVHNNGVVELTYAGTQWVSGLTGANDLYNLNINGSGSKVFYDLLISNDLNVNTTEFWGKDVGTVITVTGDVAIANTATLGYTLSRTGAYAFGSMTIDSGGTYRGTSGVTSITSKTSGGYAFDNNGDYVHDSGTLAFTYAGSANYDPGNDNAYNVTVNHASADITVVTNALPVTGALDITAGIFRPWTNAVITGTSSITGSLLPATASVTFNSACTVNGGGQLGENTAYTAIFNAAFTCAGTFHAPNATGTFNFNHSLYSQPTTIYHDNGTIRFIYSGIITYANAVSGLYNVYVATGCTLDSNFGFIATGELDTVGAFDCNNQDCRFGSVYTNTGTLTGSTATMTITSKNGSSVSWNNTGTWNPNGGTVDFTGQSGTYKILQSTIFESLIITVTAACTYQFESGETFTCNTCTNLNGSSGQLLTIDSTGAGDWYYDIASCQDHAYLNVNNSDATPGDGAWASFSTDGGTNTEWYFASSSEYIWDGGGANNKASTNDNWMGNSAPGVSAQIQYTSASTKNCEWDIATIGGHIDILMGYTGIITLENGVTWESIDIMDGTLSVGSNTLINSGQTNMTGGLISCTSSSVLEFYDTLSISGGVFGTATTGYSLLLDGSYVQSGGVFHCPDGNDKFTMSGTSWDVSAGTFNEYTSRIVFLDTTVTVGYAFHDFYSVRIRNSTFDCNGYDITIANGLWLRGVFNVTTGNVHINTVGANYALNMNMDTDVVATNHFNGNSGAVTFTGGVQVEHNGTGTAPTFTAPSYTVIDNATSGYLIRINSLTNWYHNNSNIYLNAAGGISGDGIASSAMFYNMNIANLSTIQFYAGFGFDLIVDNQISIATGSTFNTWDGTISYGLTVATDAVMNGTLDTKASTISLSSGQTSINVWVRTSGQLLGSGGNHTWGSIKVDGAGVLNINCDIYIDSHTTNNIAFQRSAGSTINFNNSYVYFSQTGGTQLLHLSLTATDFGGELHVNNTTVQFYNLNGATLTVNYLYLTNMTTAVFDTSETVTGTSHNINADAIELQANATFLANASTITLAYDLILGDPTGSFSSTTATMYLGTGMTNYGIFTHNNGTVEFTCSGALSEIRGSTTFNNIIMSTTTTHTVSIEDGTTQTFEGSVTMNGAAANYLSLESMNPGTQYYTVFTATATKTLLTYLKVKDANATGSDPAHTPIDPTNSVDLGNNILWFTPPIPTSGIDTAFDGFCTNEFRGFYQ